jgi:hypothetical protein
MNDTQYFHGDFNTPYNPPSNPITIMSGNSENNITFDADPSDGTIAVSTTGKGEGDYVTFTVEEFGLIAALLIGTADGDY